MADIKTKEDVVRENYEKVFTSQKYDNSVNKEMNKLYFFPAMDEYAAIMVKSNSDALVNLILEETGNKDLPYKENITVGELRLMIQQFGNKNFNH